jgi:CDGSH iron-sulfur domain-containing protein 3
MAIEVDYSLSNDIDERKTIMDHSHHKPNMPIQVDLEKGKTYYWCTCGKTSDKPFCDQSHEGTEYLPLEFTVERDKTAFLCSCRKTKNPPYCDSSHEGDHAYIMSELVR